MLSDVGVRVIFLTCDGPSTPIAMLQDLGASIKSENLNPSFPHPSLLAEKVCVFLCILYAPTLTQHFCMKDGSSNNIEWKYIHALHQLQEEGLHLGNKLRDIHLSWYTQKMKVKLAPQTLSSSIADALMFCRDSLHLPHFKNCQGTVDFIYI